MLVRLMVRNMNSGTRAFCRPRNQPTITKLASVPGALQTRIEKYSRAFSLSAPSAPRSFIATWPIGDCSRITVSAMICATTSAWPSDTRRPS